MLAFYHLVIDERTDPLATLPVYAARAQRPRIAAYCDHPARDGIARCDDVWSA